MNTSMGVSACQPCVSRDIEELMQLSRNIEANISEPTPQYGEQVQGAADPRALLYRQRPTSEDYDFLGHVCTTFGLAPSPSELQHYRAGTVAACVPYHQYQTGSPSIVCQSNDPSSNAVEETAA